MTMLLFLGTVATVAILAVVGIGWVGDQQDERRSTTQRWVWGTISGVILWLALTGGLAASGTLADFDRTPPPMLALAGAAGILTLVLAFSPFGTRLAFGLPMTFLVGFQAFRIVVEVVLAQLYHVGQVPVQMTYEGRNFDVFSGTSALLIAWISSRLRLPQRVLLIWNVIGLGLLINIVVIALLSTPIPLRVFMNEPANTIIATWPYVWLPTFLVQAALFGHILVFRRLLVPAPVQQQTRRNAVRQ
jgi:hypothetical protein